MSSCVYPSVMTTRSVFTAWITDLASSVKRLLNVSSTNVPCYLNSTLGYLFQTTSNQSTSVNLVIHFLVLPKIISSISNYAIVIGFSSELDMVVVSWCLWTLLTLQSATLFHRQMFVITYNTWHNFLVLLFPPSGVWLRRDCIFLLFHDCLFCMFSHHNLKVQIILFDIIFPFTLLSLFLAWSPIFWWGTLVLVLNFMM
jgi:hypothetical protein